MIAYFTFLLFQFVFLLCCGCVEFPNVPKTKCSGKSERECFERLPDFSYGDSPEGPDNWPAMYEKCGGNNQSPINIDMSDLDTSKVGPLQWGSAYFNTPKTMTLTSNNHTVVLTATFPEDCQPKISGGCLHKPYIFSALHFHWGSRDSKGSEHTIDEFAYPMEMHVIHVGGAHQGESSNDRVVMAYFFQFTEKECKVIDKIVDVFYKAIKHPFKPIKIKSPFNLAALVQPFSSEYATYRGSLTTPPCTEGVRWIVYPYPLDINKKQIEKFRMVSKYAPGMMNNYRPIQPVNDRKVYFVT